MAPAEAIADLVRTMNKGQYLLLVEALRTAGGELRIDPKAFLESVKAPSPRVDVDGDDGPVILRVSA